MQRDIEIRAGSRTVGAAEGTPTDQTDGRAGVIVIHDILGLNDVTRGHVSRLASNGYHAIAPDLLGHGLTRTTCTVRTMRDFARRDGASWEILDAARLHLIDSGVDEERIGAMGFCMGSGFALAYSMRANLSVVAPFYGEVPTEILRAEKPCPIVGGWGGNDRVFAGRGRKLKKHLEKQGSDHDLVIYDNVGHSYMDDHPSFTARLGRFTPIRAEYDETAAEDSWKRVLSFFATHL